MCKKFNIGASIERLTQSSSDRCSARKGIAQDFFQPLLYQRLVTRSSVASEIDLREVKREIAQVQEKLLRTGKGSEEQKT